MKKNVTYASLVSRVVASLIDQGIFLILPMLPFVYLFSQQPDLKTVITNGIIYITFISIPLFFVQFFYAAYMLSLFGATIGKMVVGNQVVTEAQKFITFKEALFRELIAKVVSNAVLWIGFFAAYKSPTKQTWHDQMAGSYVVEQSPRVILGILTVILLIGAFGYLCYMMGQSIMSNTALLEEVFSFFSFS